MPDDPQQHFHLVVEFHSLDEFAAFVAVLRSQEDQAIEEMAARLTADTKALVAAQAAAASKGVTKP